jgi:hypothetical protein
MTVFMLSFSPGPERRRRRVNNQKSSLAKYMTILGSVLDATDSRCSGLYLIRLQSLQVR